MVLLNDYIKNWGLIFSSIDDHLPWLITSKISTYILPIIPTLNSEYVVRENIAIHKSAKVEEGVILKGPIVISSGCFIGAHAYLRGGVILGEKVSVGPGCEIKSSLIMDNSALAHFNFVGDSILGSFVNMEAGSVIANHFNEREDKTIYVRVNGNKISAGVQKFGALVGDGTKIGANAVLSPGTILSPGSVVRRLELVEQC